MYEGVIDNEEFTSCLYPCDPDSWEVVLDPTGMATRALSGEADTVPGWKVELADDPDSIDAWAAETGVSAKRLLGTAVFDSDVDDGWSNSETDPVDIPCPGCGHAFRHDVWTLVNARQNPQLVEQLSAGKLFEFTCPECGYTASLVNPCLFLDPAHGVCIYLVINDDMAQGVAGMFADMDNDDTAIGRSRKRIVRNRHQLKEKAALYASGLDDRAIEVLKTGAVGLVRTQCSADMDEMCEVYFPDSAYEKQASPAISVNGWAVEINCEEKVN